MEKDPITPLISSCGLKRGYVLRNILLLQDRSVISSDLSRFIQTHCRADVHLVHEPGAALKVAHDIDIDLLITDIELGKEIDGIDVAIQLDALYQTPILFLTSSSDDKMLERASRLRPIGYRIRPIREDELIVQHRLIRYQYECERFSLLDLGKGYHYDDEQRRLLRDDEPIALTAKEHQLFLLLLNMPGEVVSFTYLDEQIWPADHVSSGTRRQLFYRLKAKLPDLDIETVTMTGYRLNF